MKLSRILNLQPLLAASIALAAYGAAADVPAFRGKVLVVVSSEDTLPLKNGASYSTGYYLNELSVPAQKLSQEGYQLVFANPRGDSPAMDKRSDDAKYFGGSEARRQEIRSFHDSLTALKNPKTLKQVIAGGLSQYDGIFVPGGHAPMTDLMQSRELGVILRYFHEQGKATGLICHGPIALASAVEDPSGLKKGLIVGDQQAVEGFASDWIYRGYRMTIFSDAEEAQAQAHMGGEPLFRVESALRSLGGEMSEAPPWKSEVIEDRELVTGQNPYSDEQFVEAYLRVLGR